MCEFNAGKIIEEWNDVMKLYSHLRNIVNLELTKFHSIWTIFASDIECFVTDRHFLFTFCGWAGRVLDEWAEFGWAGGDLHLWCPRFTSYEATLRKFVWKICNSYDVLQILEYVICFACKSTNSTHNYTANWMAIIAGRLLSA